MVLSYQKGANKMLECKNLMKRYMNKTAVEDISLKIESGKTTSRIVVIIRSLAIISIPLSGSSNKKQMFSKLIILIGIAILEIYFLFGVLKEDEKVIAKAVSRKTEKKDMEDLMLLLKVVEITILTYEKFLLYL